MNENKSPRKEAVKTAAIIFLAIMLVLTFFSNTIMNYSLPEVNTSRASQGTISEQIRGSGSITAGETYNVTIDQTREVRSVSVKQGDTVAAGDILFELEDEDSAELAEAQDTLASLELEYEKGLIELSAKQGYTTELAEISDAEDELERLNTQYAAALVGTDDLSIASEEYKSAKKAVDSLTAEKNNLTAALASVDTDDLLDLTGDYYTRMRTAKDNVTAAQTAYDNANTDYDELVKEIGSGTDYSDEIAAKRREIQNSQALINQYYVDLYNLSAEDDSSSLNASITSESNNLTGLQQELSALLQKASLSSVKKSQLKLAEDKVNSTEKKLTAAKDTLTAETRSVKLALKEEINELERKLTAANDALSDAEYAKSDAEASGGMSASSLAAKISEQEIKIRNLKAALTTKQSTDNTQIETAKLDLQSKERSIEAQKEKIEKLKAEATDAVVASKVAGRVESVSIAAGETPTAGTTAVTIAMTSKGYTLTFSVKADQARKVQLGDKAEITSWYSSDDITATLVAIKPDTSDPQSSRILEFRITGSDITTGQNISLAMGSKGQQYSTVVPNSAIREDSNGKFVLVMEAKSSALGNRYKAVRYDVEVIAKDDNNSAVSGLLGSEFVITTSTKPIEAGEQVRPAE